VVSIILTPSIAAENAPGVPEQHIAIERNAWCGSRVIADRQRSAEKDR
jgi:hypothetical protein